MSSRKVPGIARGPGIQRFHGIMHSYYSPFWQQTIVKRIQSSSGKQSPKRLASQALFKKICVLIKNASPEDQAAATALSQGTPYLPRDLLMKAATGTLIEFTDTKGRTWMGTRVAIQNIQPMLDSISNTPGAMLFRNANYWDALTPPASKSVLYVDPATNIPEWLDASDACLALLNALAGEQGDVLYRTDTGWTTLPPGAAGDFLQTLGPGADLQWEAIPPPGPSPGDDVIASWTAVPALPGFDPMFTIPGTAFSNANKTATWASGGPYNYWYGTTARYTGKLYFEHVPGTTGFAAVGLSNVSARYIDDGSGSPGNFGSRLRGQIGWASDGGVRTGGGVTENNIKVITTIQTFLATSRCCVAVDLDNYLIWFRTTAGNWNNSALADPATGVGGISTNFLYAGAATTMVVPGGNDSFVGASSLYLKAADFTQAVPAGFTSWSGL